RQYEDQKLLVLNNFYATEVSEKILLKPYQTLAIYVN
ncbi:alpha,alpha-phosphotrehalase, partial [Streptococcus mitis]|nr:alpha,alpha-phosphotrehalase [Streptococcus mitis]